MTHYACNTPDGGLTIDTGSAVELLRQVADNLDGRHPLQVIEWSSTAAAIRGVADLLELLEADLDRIREDLKALPEKTAQAVMDRLRS